MVRRGKSGEGEGRRCAVAECAGAVASGRVICGFHAGTEEGIAAVEAVRRVSQSLDGERAAERFERALERGEYGGLFDDRLRAIMREAAAQKGFAEEIGALRVMMAKLVMDGERDPVDVAHALARLTTATVQAVRADELSRSRATTVKWAEDFFDGLKAGKPDAVAKGRMRMVGREGEKGA